MGSEALAVLLATLVVTTGPACAPSGSSANPIDGGGATADADLSCSQGILIPCGTTCCQPDETCTEGVCTSACSCDGLGRSCGLVEIACGVASCGTCEGDDVCTETGKCAQSTPGTGDTVAHLQLIRQTMLHTTSVLADIGKAEAIVRGWQPLPLDDRDEYFTDESERCTKELNSQYPHDYNGQSWPTTAPVDIGDIHFLVDGAPGEIILEGHDLQNPIAGTYYFHGDVPPRLTSGSATYADLFEPAYVLSGSEYSVTTDGGTFWPATQWGKGAIPPGFTIVEPAVEETPNLVVDMGEDLLLSWSPPRPRGTMKIYLAVADAFASVILTCVVEDDGETVIPKEALAGFAFADVALSFRRHEIHTLVRDGADGNNLYIELDARVVRAVVIKGTKSF